MTKKHKKPKPIVRGPPALRKTKKASKVSKRRLVPIPLVRHARCQPLHGYWDWDNSTIPHGLDYTTAILNVKKTMYQKGYDLRRLHIFGVKDSLTDDMNQKLLNVTINGLTITVNIVEADPDPSNDRDNADLEMSVHMASRTLLLEPPAPTLVLASDQDYTPTIQNLKGCKFIVIISFSVNKTAHKFTTVTEGLIWDDLVRGNLLDNNFSGIMFSERPPSPTKKDLPPSGLMKIFWDIKSLPIPEGVAYNDLEANIRNVLHKRGHGECTKIYAYAKQEEVTPKVMKKLETGGIEMKLVPPTHTVEKWKREYVDVKMSNDIFKCLSQEMGISSILLISDSKHFDFVADNLTKHGYKFLLGHSAQVDEMLKVAVPPHLALDWNSLAKGL